MYLQRGFLVGLLLDLLQQMVLMIELFQVLPQFLNGHEGQKQQDQHEGRTDQQHFGNGMGDSMN